METIAEVLEDGDFELTEELLNVAMPEKHVYIDARGVEHYDMAQNWQCAVQCSDTNSAIYWLAKWIKSGEDPRFIARRIAVSAAEDAARDAGAHTAALLAVYAAENIGLPECKINMATATIAICEAERDRAGNDAIAAALKDIDRGFEPNAIHANSVDHNTNKGYTEINKRYVK
jgi:putative ATPase